MKIQQVKYIQFVKNTYIYFVLLQKRGFKVSQLFTSLEVISLDHYYEKQFVRIFSINYSTEKSLKNIIILKTYFLWSFDYFLEFSIEHF